MNNIAVVGYESYARPFYELGNVTFVPFGKDLPKNTNIIVFTGGEDLCPKLYGDSNMGSSCNHERDFAEAEYYTEAKYKKIKMVGICRGMQLFTAMTGGKLIQDVTGHSCIGTHSVWDKNGKEYFVNSLHHQMCVPKKGTYALLAHANGLSSRYIGSRHAVEWHSSVFGTIEPEALYFHEIKALGVQWHPEMLNQDAGGYKLFTTLFNNYIK